MIQQGTDEWKQLRLGKLTASRMADAMAKKDTAAYKNYVAQLVAERLTGQAGESFTNAAMAWGTEHEPLARSEYEITTGFMVEQVPFVCHPEIEWCGASPDGMVNGDGLVEIKCPNTATHIDYLLAGKPPAKYVPQMALQLICTGRKWCDFVSLDPRMPDQHRLFVVRFQPEPAYLEKVDAAAREFLDEVAATIERLQARAA